MNREKAYNIVMDGVMVLIAGYYVYMAVNEMTDGRFGRELSLKITRFKGRIKETVERERKFQQYIGPTLFDAITIIDDSGEAGGNRKTD